MGEVLRALDRMTGRQVAIKRLKPQTNLTPSDSNSRMLALAHEFKILAGLRHPNIISVLDYGFETPQQPYVVMDYLEGATDFLAYVGSLSEHGRLLPIIQLLQALTYLHRRGVVHRDLKPSNVVVMPDGVVKVLDFGLAGESDSPDAGGGTLLYMAPEVLMGGPTSPASDLYAVGVLLYETLTGQHPFRIQGSTGEFVERVLQHLPNLEPVPPVLNRTTLEMPMVAPDTNEPTIRIPRPAPPSETDPTQWGMASATAESAPITPDPPKTLRELVGRLLTKNPTERYHDAAHVLTDLCITADIAPPVESIAIRESFLQAAKFVGREQELATLDAALRQVQLGQGAAWLVGGESGVGKSRLLDEVRIRALVAGMPVLRGQAVREVGQPLALWQNIIRHLAFMVSLTDYEAGLLQLIVPEVSQWHAGATPIAPLDSPIAQHSLERLLGVLQALLARAPQPLVLILEDIHWGADGVAAVTASNTRHLILASYRHDEAPDLPSLLPACRVMPLARLGAESVALVSEAMLGPVWPELVERLAEESEGNAFFLVEMVRSLAEEAGGLAHVVGQTLPMRLLTGGIQTVLERRLARIPTTARPLLELAALAGRRLDLDLLGRLAAVDLDQWLIACSSVLEVDDQHWRFAHDKLREAISDRISPDAKPRAHQRIALALEGRGNEADSVLLAYHWRQSGNVYKELSYSVKAADWLLGCGMKFEALAYAQRAKELAATQTIPVAERIELLRVVGMTLQINGYTSAALTDLEEGLTQAEASGDQLGVARLHVALGYLTLIIGKPQQAIDHCTQALTLGQSLADEYAITRALYGLGAAHVQLSRLTEAKAYLHQALAYHEAANNPYHIAETLSHLGNAARNQGHIEEASTYYERALAIVTAIGETRVIVPIRLGISSIYYRRGELDKAIAEAEAVVSLEREHRFRRGEASALSTLGLYLAVAGDHARAEACWLEVIAYYRESNERLPLARVVHNLGDLYGEMGDWAQAKTYLEESLVMFEEIGNRQGRLITLGKLADIALHQDSPATAEAFYRRILTEAVALQLRSDMVHAVYGLGRLKALKGDKAEAVAYLRVVVDDEAGYPDIRQKAQALLDTLTDVTEIDERTLDDIITQETK